MKKESIEYVTAEASAAAVVHALKRMQRAFEKLDHVFPIALCNERMQRLERSCKALNERIDTAERMGRPPIVALLKPATTLGEARKHYRGLDLGTYGLGMAATNRGMNDEG